MKKAVVPGTYDPLTSGHLDIIERAAGLFAEVVVGVAASPQKNGRGPLFSLEERVDLARAATVHLSNVTVMPFDQLLVDFTASIGAELVVKGLRVVTDFEHEFQMAALNWRLDSDIETVFIMSVPEYMYLSSSAVKEIAQHGGSVCGLVPPCVEAPLTAKYAGGL